MIKRILTAGAAAALFVSSAVPSFAANFNFAGVSNNVNTRSNSGRNLTAGLFAFSNTGNASSDAVVTTVANTNSGSNFNTNIGLVGNNVNTRSNSGRNMTVGAVAASNTGDASSTACVTTVVNTNVN